MINRSGLIVLTCPVAMSSLVSNEITAAGNSQQQTSVIAHKRKLYVCSKQFTVLTCLEYINLNYFEHMGKTGTPGGFELGCAVLTTEVVFQLEFSLL